MKRIILETTYEWAKENKSPDNQVIVEQIIRTIEYWKITDERD